MYKIIIVDDEKSIRSGMSKLPWESWGFRVCGTAKDGLEALELIAEDKPDVVLSDIRMPNMDGVELMKYLNQNYPEIKIIILSGYSDFEYLNYSIKNRVVEYLLKPTDIDEFETLFKRLKETLDAERKRDTEYENSRNYYLDSLLLDLLLGYTGQESDRGYDILDESGITVDDCYVVLLYMEWSPKFRDGFYLTKTKKLLADSANKMSSGLNLRFFIGYQEKITGIVSSREGFDVGELRAYLEKVLAYLYESTGIEVYACVSSHCTDRRMLPQCAQQTIITAHRRAFSPNDKIGFYTPVKAEGPFFKNVSFNYELLISCIASGKKEQELAEIERVFNELEAAPEGAYVYAENLCLELLFFLSRKSMEHNIDFEEILEDLGFSYDDLRRMVGLRSLKRVIEDVVTSLTDCFSINAVPSDKNSSLAYKIKEYVDEEYLCNHISLEYVSDKVEKSSAYISRLFKEEFGCNFSEYVTNKRLEKSKELLKDESLKIYEIARKTGYADVSNFIKVFKKKYGISPGDYRSYVK
ncbi:MAG: response regulator [Clostridiales bacterium]|nr:response regulator [Clostridiales bacterium]